MQILIRSFLCILGVAFALRTALLRWLFLVEVDGRSMEPTFEGGDLLLVDRNTREISVGQIIVFHLSTDPDTKLVKRVSNVFDDGVWVTSDNPEGSMDSDDFGAISFADVEGHVKRRVYRRHKVGRQ